MAVPPEQEEYRARLPSRVHRGREKSRGYHAEQEKLLPEQAGEGAGLLQGQDDQDNAEAGEKRPDRAREDRPHEEDRLGGVTSWIFKGLPDAILHAGNQASLSASPG